MTNPEIQALLEKQRAYYRSGATLPLKFRIAQLKKLYATVQEQALREAAAPVFEVRHASARASEARRIVALQNSFK